MGTIRWARTALLLRVLLLCCVVFTAALPPETGADEKKSESIEKLIAQLADDDFDVRENASETLAKVGPKAYPALRVARWSEDPEVAYRAGKLLEKYRLEVRRDLLVRLERTGKLRERSLAADFQNPAYMEQMFDLELEGVSPVSLSGLRVLSAKDSKAEGLQAWTQPMGWVMPATGQSFERLGWVFEIPKNGGAVDAKLQFDLWLRGDPETARIENPKAGVEVKLAWGKIKLQEFYDSDYHVSGKLEILTREQLLDGCDVHLRGPKGKTLPVSLRKDGSNLYFDASKLNAAKMRIEAIEVVCYAESFSTQATITHKVTLPAKKK